ncbi:RING zinc finger-like protein [Phytophthora palmivora]|uniref:RING-type E3 ubiquitin transferase n=1 Tax=Phytophthora palmivora TaxID=4796 RepID=A0A2P4Y5E4_9STRA|nr:RING zinc finger-like protein [Phytophthora palmivora]
MGHTASVNRQRRSSTGTLYGEPAGAATAPRGSYTPAQMQALYLSRGRPDMAFMSNQGRTHVDVPELQQTCTVKNHVNLKKTSLKLQQSPAEPLQYALEFSFDATKPCRISVYLVAAEIIDAETGSSSFALLHADKIPVLTQRFSSGLGQHFVLKGGVMEEETDKEDQEKHEQSTPLLDFSPYDADELVYKAGTTQFPLIIVLEVSSDRKRPQSQSTFCTFVKKGEDLWDIKMLKQKILVDGLTYELQEIYGIDGSVAAAPKTDRSGAAGDGQADTAQTAKDEIEIPEGAECIICMCEPRNTTVLPCRHMCLCSECAEALRKSSSTCPICRTPVEALLQIRVEAKESTTTEIEEDKTEGVM